MGLTTARNQGVQASTGNWLAFLDADDWFLPKKLEQQRQCALENEQAVLIYSRFFTSLKGVETPARFTPPAKLWPALRYKCGLQICTVILRRDAFDAVGGFDVALRVCEDWDLWLRLAKCYSTARFDAVPEPLAVYRITPGSLSSNAMRMFKAKAALIECQCLHGTTGLSRYLLRRRISAFLHYDTAIALREEGSLLDLPFIFKSIALWPFPGNEIPLKRYKVAAVMLKQHLFRSIARLISLTKETPSYKD
jgi:glycosyltransferase involved in cell wall biosynthesis